MNKNIDIFLFNAMAFDKCIEEGFLNVEELNLSLNDLEFMDGYYYEGALIDNFMLQSDKAFLAVYEYMPSNFPQRYLVKVEYFNDKDEYEIFDEFEANMLQNEIEIEEAEKVWEEHNAIDQKGKEEI